MSLFGRAWQKVRKHREYHRLVDELQQLDDRMLKDLGIPRHQIEVIARKTVDEAELRQSTV